MSTLPNNIQSKIDFAFDETRHVYTLSGVPLIGTTTVLSLLGGAKTNALVQWSANEAVKYVQEWIGRTEEKTYTFANLSLILEEAKTAHRKKKEGAGDLGTTIHLWLENHIKTGEMALPEEPQTAKMIQAFLDWEKQHTVKWISSEKRVYAKSLWLAGTIDFIAEVDGKVFLGDFKTSTGIWDEAFWQLSAYQYMLKEMEPDTKIDGHLVINLRKDGKLETKESYAYDTNIKGFLGLLMAYKVKNNLKTT